MVPNHPVAIQTDENRVRYAGPLGLRDYKRLLKHISDLRQKRAAKEITLDLTQCTAAYPSPVLALCAQVLRMRELHQIDVTLLLPAREPLAEAFQNHNWAYLLDPKNFSERRRRAGTSLPATRFLSSADQRNLVTRMVERMMRTLGGFSRSDLSTVEWALGEITDNVINHSQSSIGGIAQLITYRSKRELRYVVCDAGVGIPGSLRPSHPEIDSDSAALASAIREGVTRDTSLGRGFGLYGSFQISKESRSVFRIESGAARLEYDPRAGFARTHTDALPYEGTLISAGIHFSQPDILVRALRLDGSGYEPMDSIESNYEVAEQDSDSIVVAMFQEASSFTSRTAGRELRTKVGNLIRLSRHHVVILDFQGVPTVSSSFADEVFAKLRLELGAEAYGRALRLRNVAPAVAQIIQHALVQRPHSA